MDVHCDLEVVALGGRRHLSDPTDQEDLEMQEYDDQDDLLCCVVVGVLDLFGIEGDDTDRRAKLIDPTPLRQRDPSFKGLLFTLLYDEVVDEINCKARVRNREE